MQGSTHFGGSAGGLPVDSDTALASGFGRIFKRSDSDHHATQRNQDLLLLAQSCSPFGCRQPALLAYQWSWRGYFLL
jgi:hypothetical protein